MEEMRLQKYLALCSVASRRASEEIIASGRVSVNGETVTGMGTKVMPGDEVCVDGKRISPEEKKVYKHPICKMSRRTKQQNMKNSHCLHRYH